MKRLLITFFIAFAVIISTSCRTTDVEIADNLTPGEFFQEAQTASSEYKDYDRALLYYNAFIERYPDEPLLIIEAEYEIALLYHKKDDDETALRLFNGILEKYLTPDAAVLPAWPNVLSKKMIGIIEDSAAAEEPADTPAELQKKPEKG